jgi:hypothetical protein
MGFHNDKQNSTNPMLDTWVTSCAVLSENNHLVSPEEEQMILDIAKKLKHRSKVNY